MTSPEPRVSSTSNKWDVRVASPRKLFRALHDLLDERGYVHEYEPLRAEPDAIDGMAIFKSELLGKRDSPGRDLPYLVFGIILLPTILLTTQGIKLIKESRYTLRTVARISVEGEAYLAKGGTQGTSQSEVLDVVSDARVTIELKAGAARGEYGIWRPADDKRELIRLSEERRRLEEGLSELLLTVAQPEGEAAQQN